MGHDPIVHDRRKICCRAGAPRANTSHVQERQTCENKLGFDRPNDCDTHHVSVHNCCLQQSLSLQQHGGFRTTCVPRAAVGEWLRFTVISNRTRKVGNILLTQAKHFPRLVIHELILFCYVEMSTVLGSIQCRDQHATIMSLCHSGLS